MRIFTANIKDNPDMPDAHVRHDIRAIKAWKLGWSFGGWQEIGEAADHAAIKSSFPIKGWDHIFGTRQTPITVNKRFWAVISNVFHVTHDGRAGVTPLRGFGTIICRHKIRRYLKPIAVVNTHYISGAWYGKHSVQPWRQQMWNTHHALITNEVERLHHQGYTVFVTGDFNRHYADIPKYMPGQKTLATHGYDHIFCIEAGVKVSVTSHAQYTKMLYTDHDPMMADVKLSNA